MWRWVSSPYAATFSFASENRLGAESPRPRAGDTRGGIDHDAGRLDETQGEQRREGEGRRRRVATRRGHVGLGCDLGAEQLRHPEREPAEELRGAVGVAVPLLVGGGRQSEVGGQVDDVGDPADELGDEALGLPVGQAEEHHVDTVDGGRLERLVVEVRVRPAQRRIELGDRPARVASRP